MDNSSQFCKMQFDQFHHLDDGSNTVGFALVAPLIVGVFLATLQIANLVNVQTSLNSAANSGARVASRYDGALTDGIRDAKNHLAIQGLEKGSEITIERTIIEGIPLIQIKIQKDYRVPWLDISITLNSVGKSIDEKFI